MAEPSFHHSSVHPPLSTHSLASASLPGVVVQEIARGVPQRYRNYSEDMPEQPRIIGTVRSSAPVLISGGGAALNYAVNPGHASGHQGLHTHSHHPLHSTTAQMDSQHMHTEEQSVMIDLGGIEESDTPPSGGSRNASGSSAEAAATMGPALDEQGMAGVQNSALHMFKLMCKSLEGVLPFLVLIGAKVMYDHRLGILVFAGLFGTFHYVNTKLHKLVAAQREVTSILERLESLTWLAFFLTANIFCIYYFFGDQTLYRALYFMSPSIDEMTLWSILWIAGMTDFVAKFGTVLLKTFVTALPRVILLYKRKGNYYMMIEMLSQFYRSLLPIMPWVYFLSDDKHGGEWFSIVLLLIYAFCKGTHLLGKFRELRAAFRKFRVNVSYGTQPTRSQLESCDNACPICQDKFTDPVILSCKHMYCEDCVAMWFDRDRTCPMCRATITDCPLWRDGTTYTGLQIY